eukprot:TRINITY_DN5163_c0_g1_i1.p1 TRINITY_DN5163_c0_g1~~TRINITY_DN5163_c0_g1_i1.p1  ORF type:complete len:130 (-),score=36.69 TRINITY_DN5163_c0_g1_i1:231-620(-)
MSNAEIKLSNGLFKGQFESAREIWLGILFWNCISIGCLYCVWGFLASFRFNRGVSRKTLPIYFLTIPLFATLWGFFVGLVSGVLYAAGIAFIYWSGGFTLIWYGGAIWGSCLAAFHLLISLVQVFIAVR